MEELSLLKQMLTGYETMDLVTIISNVGFPIGITIYLLYTRDDVIVKNTEAIKDLRETIIQMRK